MIIPLPTVAGLFESRTLFTVLASLATTVAVWAQVHAAEDAVAELVERTQHPVRYFCRHPLRAIVRRLR